MNTLEEFWQRFRCADTYYMTYEDADKLEALVRKAGPEDVEYLKVILPRIIRGFKSYVEATREREQEKTCSCSVDAVKESSSVVH